MSENKYYPQRNIGENSILMKEGWLVKRGHVRHNWKTRWFKLSDTSLRYYKKQNEKVPQGRIPLRNAKLSAYQSDHKQDKDREFVMLIVTSEGIEYPIQAPSGEEMKSWMQHIKDVMEHLLMENEVYSPRTVNDDGLVLSPNMLGKYIDAYGGIKKETRTVEGVEHANGFSGVGLRVWMDHALALRGSKAEDSISVLLKVGQLKIVDGKSSPDAFSESRYYEMLSSEESLKDIINGKKIGPRINESNKSNSSSHSGDDSVFSNDVDDTLTSNSVLLPSDLPPGEIVKRGILFKRGHVVPSWKARCFVLQKFPATLSYFDPSKKNPKVINVLTLHGASVFSVGQMAAQAALKMRNPSDHLFCVKIADGTLYVIMASSDIERDEWIEAIKPMCRRFKGAISSNPASPNRNI